MTNEQLAQEIIALRAENAKIREENATQTQQLAVMDANIKAAFRRIDEQKSVGDNVNKMAVAMERMACEMVRINEHTAAMQADINEIKAKPAKRWDAMIGAGISALVAAAIGWFVGRGG